MQWEIFCHLKNTLKNISKHWFTLISIHFFCCGSRLENTLQVSREAYLLFIDFIQQSMRNWYGDLPCVSHDIKTFSSEFSLSSLDYNNKERMSHNRAWQNPIHSNARADNINKQHGFAVIFALIYTKQEKAEKKSKGLDEGVLRETWAAYVWLNASPSFCALSLFCRFTGCCFYLSEIVGQISY